jgi:hypothetical protein
MVQRSLRTFSCSRCPPLTDKSLIDLASLPNLEIMRGQWRRENNSAFVYPHHAFPALRELSISSLHPDTITDLINASTSTSFTRLILTFRASTGPGALADLITLLNHRCSYACLTQLELWYMERPGIVDVVEPDSLRPLLSFRNLQIIYISSPSSYEKIDNALLEKMALAWPHLQRLEIGVNPSYGSPSRITFSGIQFLAQHCPDLERLGLSFDTSPSQWPKRGGANLKVDIFGVGCTSVLPGSSAAVGKVLSAIFPNLSKIQHSISPIPHYHQWEDMDAWQEVQRNLRKDKCH